MAFYSRGIRGSDSPLGSYSIEQMCGGLLDSIGHLNLDLIHLAGSSPWDLHIIVEWFTKLFLKRSNTTFAWAGTDYSDTYH